MSDDRDDECGKIHPNLRDICRCERAGISIEQCNRRRAIWGIGPKVEIPEPVVEHKPMSTAGKIASFVSVTAQTVWRNVVYGEKMLTAEEMQPRLDICNACTDLEVGGNCRFCGCSCNKESKVKFMNKLAHRSASCAHPTAPKWGPIA